MNRRVTRVWPCDELARVHQALPGSAVRGTLSATQGKHARPVTVGRPGDDHGLALSVMKTYSILFCCSAARGVHASGKSESLPVPLAALQGLHWARPLNYEFESVSLQGFCFPAVTTTQLHSHTATQLHSYTATQVHSHTATQPHNHTTTQPHREPHTVTLESYTTQLHSYAATMAAVQPHSHTAT